MRKEQHKKDRNKEWMSYNAILYLRRLFFFALQTFINNNSKKKFRE